MLRKYTVIENIP